MYNKLFCFNEFLIESLNKKYPSLKKVYLATKRSSGQKWLSYKGFAGDKYFIQITENNLDKIKINPDYPILNYHSDIINELLDKRLIKSENIYNHPNIISKSGSKKEFHKLVGDDENIPATVYSKKDALAKLSFPIIAKPASGHSGIGIKIVESEDELEKLDDSFDTFSEFIDKSEEHRFFNFKGVPFFWMERTPLNNKAKTGKGDASEEMHFGYAKRNISEIPKDIKDVLEKYCKIYKDFPYICFDVMRDKSGKIFIIESNSQPGVPFDSTVKLYEKIYEDFYNKPIDEFSQKKLNEYSQSLIEMTLRKDNKRFSIE